MNAAPLHGALRAGLRRISLFRWLLDLLRAAGEKGLPRQVVETALRLDFPPDEAERQVDTAIEWGRYAQALTYDDQDETLFPG